jgi:uncharacterized OB-fold protein
MSEEGAAMTVTPVVRDDYSAPFFDGAARGELMLRYSPSRGTWSPPEARLCVTTHAADLEWRAASGEGTLVSWTVIPGRSRDGTPVPDTIVGIVETAEGPWLTLRIVNADEVPPAVDRPVRVEFVHPDNSEAVPVARLVASP